MKNIKYIGFVLVAALAIISCESDEPYFGDLIYNDLANYPYVSIQDRNEDLDSLGGQNNYWGYELTPENNGTQVRIDYDSQDDNIVSHQIIVGLDGSTVPPADGVVLLTLTSFPTEIVITLGDIAGALGMTVEELQTNSSIVFGGRSIDEDGNIVDTDENFEDYLFYERHAYYYEWPL